MDNVVKMGNFVMATEELVVASEWMTGLDVGRPKRHPISGTAKSSSCSCLITARF